MSQYEPEIDGRCDPRFAAVREAFEENFRGRQELGAAVAVTLNGETVVDLWGGWADASRTRPWERDTVVDVWSTTKGPAALCLHILADRGRWTWTLRWPSTGPSSRRGQGVRAGAPSAVPPSRPRGAQGAALGGRVVRLGTDRRPARGDRALVGAGHEKRVHALTYGFLVGEVVRRVSGLLPGAFLEREVTGPLGIDFTIGLREKESGRAAELVQPPVADSSEQAAAFSQLTPVAVAALANPLVGAAEANSAGWRAAELPALNGHGTARAVAALYGDLRGRGSWDGRQVLSPRPPNGCARDRAAAGPGAGRRARQGHGDRAGGVAEW